MYRKCINIDVTYIILYISRLGKINFSLILYQINTSFVSIGQFVKLKFYFQELA